MKLYVGITDLNWFLRLRTAGATEVNFWHPSGNHVFKALEPGGLFLFKLHKGDSGKIAGGGFFVRSQLLPLELAWDAFGAENGCASFLEMKERTQFYRGRNGIDGPGSPNIGCTILAQTFFFDEKDWIDSPADWNDSIVTGKGYDTVGDVGAALYEAVMLRLHAMDRPALVPDETPADCVAARLSRGVGMFRLLVAESYQQRCAITGMDALPALVAAHIKPVSAGGENIVPNGLFLRADIGTLFSHGYLTVNADDLRVRVAPDISERYPGGRLYHSLDGHRIDLPANPALAPDRDLLDWHNKTVFVA